MGEQTNVAQIDDRGGCGWDSSVGRYRNHFCPVSVAQARDAQQHSQAAGFAVAAANQHAKSHPDPADHTAIDSAASESVSADAAAFRPGPTRRTFGGAARRPVALVTAGVWAVPIRTVPRCTTARGPITPRPFGLGPIRASANLEFQGRVRVSPGWPSLSLADRDSDNRRPVRGALAKPASDNPELPDSAQLSLGWPSPNSAGRDLVHHNLDSPRVHNLNSIVSPSASRELAVEVSPSSHDRADCRAIRHGLHSPALANRDLANSASHSRVRIHKVRDSLISASRLLARRGSRIRVSPNHVLINLVSERLVLGSRVSDQLVSSRLVSPRPGLTSHGWRDRSSMDRACCPLGSHNLAWASRGSRSPASSHKRGSRVNASASRQSPSGVSVSRAWPIGAWPSRSLSDNGSLSRGRLSGS